MAGLKNIYQQAGMNPMNSMNGDTIYDRHLSFTTQQFTPYCRVCGGEIIDAQQDEQGNTVNHQMEMYYLTHTHCMK